MNWAQIILGIYFGAWGLIFVLLFWERFREWLK